MFGLEVGFQKLKQLVNTPRQHKYLILTALDHNNIPLQIVPVHQFADQHEQVELNADGRAA